MARKVTRRFMLQATMIGACAPAVHAQPSRGAQWSAKQYVNQPVSNPLYKALDSIWAAVRAETQGRLDVTVYPQNNGLPGSDPAALKLLQSGELEFFAIMGGLLSAAVPTMDVQGLPFVFTDPQQAYRADAGELGRYLDRECEAKGIHRIKGGLFENGMRQMNMREKSIRSVDDLQGLRIRVPDGEMFRDFFRTLGAEPVSMNINQLYDALKEGRVDGQENPLIIAETNRLYEVTKTISITNHMWSGFNLIAHAAFWNGLPQDIRAIVGKQVARQVVIQRKQTDDLNRKLEQSLVLQRGMVINRAEVSSFRARLKGSFYPRWKKHIGTQAWALLEKSTGKLG